MGDIDKKVESSAAIMHPDNSTPSHDPNPWLPFFLVVGAGTVAILLAFGATQAERFGFWLGSLAVSAYAENVSAEPYWDEAEQAWRDPASGLVWWHPTPGWVLTDGLGHYWGEGSWRWRNGRAWYELGPAYAASASGVEQWRSLAAAYFPAWAVDYVLVVMECESGGRSWVTGAAGEQGLMQMSPIHAWRVGYRDMYDPATNLEAAAHLWREQGWGPWTCA